MGNEKKEVYRVHGFNIDRSALKHIASLDELKKTEIFSHLSADEQNAAYSTLFTDLKPAETAKVSAPAVSQAATVKV